MAISKAEFTRAITYVIIHTSFEVRGIFILDKALKTATITQYQRRNGDTGSTEVQVAMLTARINQLTTHLTAHRHDYYTQRGLLKLVGHRRRLLAYLNKENVGRYRELINKLGLRK